MSAFNTLANVDLVGRGGLEPPTSAVLGLRALCKPHFELESLSLVQKIGWRDHTTFAVFRAGG